MDVPLQRQDQCHGVLGDRVCVDARRAGETNAARTDLGIVAVHGGADRLNELQFLGGRQQLVSPQHGDDDDVGFG